MSTSMKKIVLESSDKETFEVDMAVAFQSVLIKDMIEEGIEGMIPLHNVTAKILSKVIEYCKVHKKTEIERTTAESDEVKKYDDDLSYELKDDQSTLFDLILAANYMNIKGLLDMTCKTVADMIKDKTPEEIRRTFHIKSDFTPEEEEQNRREYQWAFE
ncbi:hypothetical protein ACFE04_013467 [Oxalis oulophora]